MGKGGWFSAVRRAFAPEPKEKKEKPKHQKSKKSSWFWKQKSLDTDFSLTETALPDPPPTPPPLPPTTEEVKLTEAENEQSKHAYSVAYATAMAAEAAVAAAHVAAEIVRLTSVARFLGKSKEEIAAIKIQTAFRCYLARRAFRALRGLMRLKTLIQGQSVKRQSTTTLRCMQTLARVQSQIRARRIRMSEENEALQRQMLQKREKELDSIRASIGDDWDARTRSKEQIEASVQSKQEAAVRRERALAYAYSHQKMWKNSSKSASHPTFMDPNNPHWGWSWLERWMAARPWESKSMLDQELDGDVALVRSISRSSSVGDIGKNHSRRQTPSSTPLLKARSLRPASPKGSDDSRSLYSVQSERYRRHSIASSSVRDDESLASLPAVLSYMSSTTASTKARSRLPSPSPSPSPLRVEKKGTLAKGLMGSAKKRLSFTGSPGGVRRHSGPPKVDMNSINRKL